MSIAIPEYMVRTSAEWISELYFQCGKQGLNPIDGFRRYEIALSELTTGSYSHASHYAYLVDYRNYNFGALEARKTSNCLPKPKVCLETTITSYKNISVKWYPQEYRDAAGNETSDWREFGYVYRHSGDRTLNELMFV